MVDLPKVEYQSASRFLLSMSIYFLTILFILAALYYWKFYELSEFVKIVITFTMFMLLIAFSVTLYRGTTLLNNEEKSKRVRDAIERDILLREYWIKCIEYNEKAKEYNKKYSTSEFIEKGPLEFEAFLREATDASFIEKLKKNS
jgi:hypothetical protein